MKTINKYRLLVVAASLLMTLSGCDLVNPNYSGGQGGNTSNPTTSENGGESSVVDSSVSSPSGTSVYDDTSVVPSSDTTSEHSSNSSSDPIPPSSDTHYKTVRVFARVDNEADLDLTKKTVIVAPDASASNSYFGMTPNAKSETLPWYIIGTAVKIEDNEIQEDESFAEWTLSKSETYYQFSLGTDKLQSYVDGTHYSINIGANSSYSNNWTLTFGSNGQITMKSDRNVYLEYYNGSFCGYKNAVSVYLFQENGTKQVIDDSATPDIDTSDLVDSRWPNLDFTTYGETFRNTLAGLISGTTTTYSNCLSVGARAAAYPDKNSSTFIPFYHTYNSSADLATTGDCNREHTWPNSRGGGQIETDPLVIRPTFNSDNSARGNNFYGNSASNEWDPASLGFTGARGESARVILYAATRYYSKGLSLSNNPSDSTGAKTMGTLKTLLEWNLQYRPTEFEKTVNNRYEEMGYARNPFVDHPEYANFIWDENGLRKSPLDVDNIPVTSSVPGGSTSSSIPASSAPSENARIVFSASDTDTGNGYPTSETSFTMQGYEFKFYNVSTKLTAGMFQVKKTVGYLYNVTPIENIEELRITVYQKGDPEYTGFPSVTYGNAANPSTAAEDTVDGLNHSYNLHGASYFKICAHASYASYFESFRIL